MSPSPARGASFTGRRLHVYDDFVWRGAWMDPYYEREDRPAEGATFQQLFERQGSGRLVAMNTGR